MNNKFLENMSQKSPYPYGYAETNQMSFQSPDIFKYQQPNFIPDEFINLISAIKSENIKLKDQLMTTYRTLWELKPKVNSRQTEESIQTSQNT